MWIPTNAVSHSRLNASSTFIDCSAYPSRCLEEIFAAAERANGPAAGKAPVRAAGLWCLTPAGKEWEVKVPHGEGLANHPDPE
jgi:hypothetical protein